MISPKKWGSTPPSIFNDLGSAFSHLVGHQHSDMVARPLPGGGIVIDKVTPNAPHNTSSPRPSQSSSAERDPRSRSTFTFEPTVDMHVDTSNVRIVSDSLTPEENEIEKVTHVLIPSHSLFNMIAENIVQALFEAKKFQEFFAVLDRSGDNLISVEELSTLMPAEG